MFDHFLLSVVVVPPVLVLAVRLVADRLPAGSAAAVIAWSAAVAAASSTANLAVFALKALAEIPSIGRLGGWSARVVAADTAHVPWASWLGVVLLAASVVAVAVRHRRHRRLIAEASGGRPQHGDLVTVESDSPQAFAVPGRPGHVVVTTGMRDALTDDQFEALLAHERAHLAGRHHRLIRLAELAAAAHPALWWVARHVDYLVERAADEVAATRVGSRRTVARAIGAAALATAGAAPAHHGLHAAAPGGVVPRRVRLLLRPATDVRLRLLAVLPLALAVFTVLWTGEAIYDLGELLHLASR